VADLRQKIERLSPPPECTFSGLVRVRYFDFPDERIKNARDLLRLRTFVFDDKTAAPYTEFVYKTYKGVRKGAKFFKEDELRFEDDKQYEKLSKILIDLGLKKTAEYEKKRIHYRWGELAFEIDEYPELPPFVEIEAASPSAIDAVVAFLELSGHEQTPETINELLARKYPRKKLDGLVFKKVR